MTDTPTDEWKDLLAADNPDLTYGTSRNLRVLFHEFKCRFGVHFSDCSETEIVSFMRNNTPDERARWDERDRCLQLIQKDLKSLLDRPKSRRGPYMISDADIRSDGGNGDG